MKRVILFLSLCLLIGLTSEAQFTIPDSAFAAKLQQIVPNAMNGNVLDTNHLDVIGLDSLNVSSSGLGGIEGVEFFKSLRTLICYNNPIQVLNALPDSLRILSCSSCQLANLPTLPLPLVELSCANNQLSVLPLLTSSLNKLSCNGNQLMALPTLPNSMSLLMCSDNLLTALPAIPGNLTWLDCSINQISMIPMLPNGLVALNCLGNPVLSLPPLPNTLKDLECRNCQLTTLPTLPNSLENLSCSYNQLTTLPQLPDSLSSLYCFFNQLTSLPELPGSLEAISCMNNQLTSLPSLPCSMKYLYCRDNQLSCLPVLPASMDRLQCHNNNITCLPNFPPLLPPFGPLGNQSNLGFTPVLCATSDPCFPTETITGNVFRDDNGNGLLDSLEIQINGVLVKAQPGHYFGTSNQGGSYGIPADTGMFMVQGDSIPYYSITTAPHAVTIAVGSSDTANHIGYQPIPGIYDLAVDIQSGVPRPGFDNQVWLEVKNIGTEPTTGTIDLDFDGDQTFLSSTVTPTSQSGTNVNWSVPMNPGDVWNASVTLNTAANVPLGTAIDHLFAAIPATTDTTPANNSTTWNDVVVGSYDPNDKTASDSILTPTQVMNGEWIEYLIRFQNTGTFLAEHVRITDTLSTDLQWGTFEYISASHDNYWYLSNGTLVFQFDNIQLPDSNANEPDSHGFVKFRIKPDPNLTVGDAITNIANIYFDFNEPVITDPSVVLIDVSSGVGEAAANGVLIYPNPTSRELNIVSDQIIEELRLYSSDGRWLRSEFVNSSSHRIDVEGIENGIYLLELSNEYSSRVQRLIIEH